MNKFLNLKKVQSNKKQKGFTLIEILVACAIIIALSVGAFFMYNEAQHTRKMAQMHSDMEAISSACLAYEAISINAAPPAAIADLVTGLTADNSIDGIAHNSFLRSMKQGATNAPTDPWGNAYEYDASARTISCTPQQSDGTAASTVVRSF